MHTTSSQQAAEFGADNESFQPVPVPMSDIDLFEFSWSAHMQMMLEQVLCLVGMSIGTEASNKAGGGFG